jgi:DNA polymerase-3 subunit gamma/tau
MDNFIVSARKYRPSTFNSVVGQSSLTTTLKNAIKINHLAHAYLFCGPRGVGKTTCARIFAKTINCQQLTFEGEACNECESCVSFNEQRSFNIHELDAASNNSVDDIRSLIEQVRIPPQIGKYSVYIVDEVHMLSPGAFNAFLKTLEEPPSHAIFILATTEKHKIIPTILSRCQIYDFNRITVADTVTHLQYVAQSENVTVDINGLNVIAQKSDGGMRDALSIFDQLVSFCGNDITYQGVIENLNVLDYEYYFKLVEAFLVGNVSNSLLIFNDVLNKGFDAHHFITGLSMHLRDILVSKDESTLKLLEVGADIGKRYMLQAQQCNNEFLYQALKISNDCDLNYRISKNKRLLVELAIIKMCQINIQKKTDLLNGIENQVVQKIIVQKTETTNPVKPQVLNASNTLNNQSTAPVPTPTVEKQQITDPIPTPKQQAVNNFQRPVSISISRTNSVSSPETPAYEQIAVHKIIENKPFTDEDLLNTWNAFGETIQDEIKKIGFQNSNFPKRISETEFEILVNNVMQSNELRKIQTDITTFMINRLSNSNIKMIIKVAEENEIQRTLSPEEKYKILSETNPELEKLRKNLNLEID